MNQNEKLSSAFDRLAQRLYKLKNDNSMDIQEPYVPSHSINDLLNGEILTCDLEDAQEYLHHYINEVELVKGTLPTIVNRFSFPPKMPFYAHSETEESTKSVVLHNLTTELDYYLDQLNTLLATVIEKHESLGDDRFSNAGFKVKLNLKVEEVGSFFNLLRESGLIPTVKSDGTEFTKKELAVFIQKNFSCTTTDNISLDSLINSLNRSKQKAESVVEDWLEKLLDIAKIDP